MRFAKFFLFFSIGVIYLFSCNKFSDLGIIPAQGTINEPNSEECDLKNLTHSEGLNLTFGYSANRLPIEIEGSPYFNRIRYQQEVLYKIENIGSSTSKISTELDSLGNITLLSFISNSGSESFEMSYNTSNQLIKMFIDVPVFQESIELNFEYDQKGNIKKIKRKDGDTSITILENLEFDEKKAPFIHQKQMGQILSYKMALAAISGEANYTYFHNVNNVTQSVISNESDRIEFSTNYVYMNEFPTDAEISKNKNGNLTSLSESYTYYCYSLL
jgi:hypothetical protein